MQKNYKKRLKPLIKQDFYATLLNNLDEAINIIDLDFKILYWNPASEQITGFSASEMIGKSCSKNILVDTDDQKLTLCGKACPVKLSLKDGKIRKVEAYARHKEGFRYPINLKIIPIPDKKGKILAAVESYIVTSPKASLAQNKIELEKMGVLDRLTAQGNRKYLKMQLHNRLEDLKRHNLSFGVLYVCVNNIGSIFEDYGSITGHKVLMMISKTLSKNIRFFEIAGRWEDEEFLIILLNMNKVKIELVANKLRLLVAQASIKGNGKPIKTSISVGGILAHSTDSIDSLVNRAKEMARINNSRAD